MKVAIPVWVQLVSTVFDFCDRLLIVHIDSGKIGKRRLISISGSTVIDKCFVLQNFGVHVLLCGALSMPLQRMIEAAGITVVPSLTGRVDEILQAYISNRLPDRNFMLPGYRPIGKHRKRRRGTGRGMGYRDHNRTRKG